MFLDQIYALATTGFQNMMAVMGWVSEVLKKDAQGE
jgi:hypothetical protein